MLQNTNFWFTFGPLILINTYVLVSLGIFSLIYKKLPKTAEVEDRHSSVVLNKWFREYWMWLTAPIFKICLYFKVTPNFISIVGSVFALLSGVAIAMGKMGLCGWLMVLGASFDFFDGRMARLTNQETQAGSFLDSSLDRVSEGLTLTGIAFYYKDSPIFWIVMFAYLGSMLTSYTKAKGETMGVDYSGGMMQRPERIAYLGAGAILSPFIAYFLHPWLVTRFPDLTVTLLQGYLYAVPLAFVCLFCNIATINRIVNIMKLLQKKEFGDKV